MERLWAVSLAVGAVLLASCSQRDQDQARQRAAEARAKAREGAHELAHEAKRAADKVNRSVNQAVNGTGARADRDEAKQKVRRGGEDLKVATGGAGAKLDQAALLAKVKAKLANDVGLSTVTGVDVDVNRDVVTLRGSVRSGYQKQAAEDAARQVAGVRTVVNNLEVKQ